MVCRKLASLAVYLAGIPGASRSYGVAVYVLPVIARMHYGVVGPVKIVGKSADVGLSIRTTIDPFGMVVGVCNVPFVNHVAGWPRRAHTFSTPLRRRGRDVHERPVCRPAARLGRVQVRRHAGSVPGHPGLRHAQPRRYRERSPKRPPCSRSGRRGQRSAHWRWNTRASPLPALRKSPARARPYAKNADRASRPLEACGRGAYQSSRSPASGSGRPCILTRSSRSSIIGSAPATRGVDHL
jgi:hypothetical protein